MGKNKDKKPIVEVDWIKLGMGFVGLLIGAIIGIVIVRNLF
jgi:hypothetical protein